jgi:Cu+-exporting ATPase
MTATVADTAGMKGAPGAPSRPGPIAAAAPSGRRQTDLTIGGMTCATCANRVERKLNRMPDVTATVNFATETAT